MIKHWSGHRKKFWLAITIVTVVSIALLGFSVRKTVLLIIENHQMHRSLERKNYPDEQVAQLQQQVKMLQKQLDTQQDTLDFEQVLLTGVSDYCGNHGAQLTTFSLDEAYSSALGKPVYRIVLRGNYFQMVGVVLDMEKAMLFGKTLSVSFTAIEQLSTGTRLLECSIYFELLKNEDV